jgi:Protein tyrosine and serine/threonine kinase
MLLLKDYGKKKNKNKKKNKKHTQTNKQANKQANKMKKWVGAKRDYTFEKKKKLYFCYPIYLIPIIPKRPTIPTDCPKEIKELIERCWNGDPAKRPMVEEVHAALVDFQAFLPHMSFPQRQQEVPQK